jgi:hypothetical protein
MIHMADSNKYSAENNLWRILANEFNRFSLVINGLQYTRAKYLTLCYNVIVWHVLSFWMVTCNLILAALRKKKTWSLRFPGMLGDVGWWKVVHVWENLFPKIGPTGCLETCVNNYQPTETNIRKERRPQAYSGGSLRSRLKKHIWFRVWHGLIITWCCYVTFLKNKAMMQLTQCADVKTYVRQQAAERSTLRWHLDVKSVFVNSSSCNENENAYEVSKENYSGIHDSTDEDIQQ